MSIVSETRSAPMPDAPDPARTLIRWICTQNPFYVISAGLFLVGLWISFGGQGADVDHWALMTGLGAYTLLLAGTALLLVRYANVWDDVRTVLLLVVVMFLATSVTFDEVFALDPSRGFIFYVVGLSFAIAVSETILRGIHLRLPTLFRLPYYAILALFFLYPLALAPLLDQPQSEELMWGLFAFSTAAGLIFLTLLPAIHRGPQYVQGNGSPWPWPLYPWSLFVMLALAVPGRAFLLCWSMHLIVGPNMNELIFGGYFLVPFGLALAILLLHLGLEARRRGQAFYPVLGAALALPALLVVLVLAAQRSDPLYLEFQETVTARLGADPLTLTLLLCGVFYLYAAARRMPAATEAFAATLLALAFVGPETLRTLEPASPRLELILAAALFQLGLGLWRRSSVECALGIAGLVLWTFAPTAGTIEPRRAFVAFHLVLVACLVIGAMFRDPFARLLRGVGVLVAMAAAVSMSWSSFLTTPQAPEWLIWLYPLAVGLLLAAYGIWQSHGASLVSAVCALAVWLVAGVWRGYQALRLIIVGIDYLAISLLFLAVAIGISLGKSRLPAPRAKEARAESSDAGGSP